MGERGAGGHVARRWLTDARARALSRASQAYAFMRKLQKNQCIVVSGESGAGKTETNRQLLNYLVWRGTASDAQNTLTQKILDTNPILEALGNAKTTRNNNSSRFGRYVLVRFDKSCAVVGAQVRTFLLERSRVTSTSKQRERSYHVLYELCAGKTVHTGAQPADAFRYLSLSGTTTIDGHDDSAHYSELHGALLSVGISADELEQVWAFLGGMLYLGNVAFGAADDAHIAATGAADPVRVAEKALGVADMVSLLETRQIIVNGETTVVRHTPQQAGAARDALVKIMYDRLFTYLVNRINCTVDDSSRAEMYIGLLDVYGFEFFEVNSFEQLCINFANEKLQQFFLTTVFTNETATYKEEGIPWTPVTYADNSACLALLEGRAPPGILPLINEECRASAGYRAV